MHARSNRKRLGGALLIGALALTSAAAPAAAHDERGERRGNRDRARVERGVESRHERDHAHRRHGRRHMHRRHWLAEHAPPWLRRQIRRELRWMRHRGVPVTYHGDYYCVACRHRFEDRRAFRHHLRHRHDVARRHFERALVRTFFGWVFYG
ncbi:MAG: hypothetical protein QNK03_22325 [Myxococcota bacterium]|nr:hypothetical protein [Myxococcota bacterium]